MQSQSTTFPFLSQQVFVTLTVRAVPSTMAERTSFFESQRVKSAKSLMESGALLVPGVSLELVMELLASCVTQDLSHPLQGKGTAHCVKPVLLRKISV